MTVTDAGAALSVSHLSAGYRRREVIHALSMPPLQPGSVHCLIGPNAAGKSTLLRALGGLLPARGRVLLGGQDLVTMAPQARSRLVTYMPQAIPEGIGLRVFETVLGALHASASPLTANPLDAQRLAADTLDAVGMKAFAMEPLGRLSGGQRQLVSLAQALVRRPRVLLLDEPISALDLRHQWQVMQLVRELAIRQRMIVLTVLHDLQMAAHWSDGVIVLKRGTVVATGRPEEAITVPVLAEVYGVDARVTRSEDGRLLVLIDDLVHAQA